MTGTMSWGRTLVVLALLLVTVFALHLRGGEENLPPRRPLAEFPLELGPWRGFEEPIDEQTREVLGDGDFRMINFVRSPQEPFVNLFIAYFPTQRTGSTIHSPQNCLPGAGWVPVLSGREPLGAGSDPGAVVNRFVIGKGMDRQLVLYWYQSHGRVIASEYWAKFYLVADSMRWNRSDGALVRVITPLLREETIEQAEARAREFMGPVLPLLPQFIPD